MNRHKKRVEDRKQKTQARLGELYAIVNSVPVSATFGRTEALIELEQARRVAMVADPPQAGAMVAATMGKAKVMGLIVEQQAVGSPDEFKNKSEEELIAIMRERVGPKETEIFLKAVEQMRRAYDGPIIEGQAEKN